MDPTAIKDRRVKQAARVLPDQMDPMDQKVRRVK